MPPLSHRIAGDGSVLVDVPRVDRHLGLGLPCVQLLEGQPQGRRPSFCNGAKCQRKPRLLVMTSSRPSQGVLPPFICCLTA